MSDITSTVDQIIDFLDNFEITAAGGSFKKQKPTQYNITMNYVPPEKGKTTQEVYGETKGGKNVVWNGDIWLPVDLESLLDSSYTPPKKLKMSKDDYDYLMEMIEEEGSIITDKDNISLGADLQKLKNVSDEYYESAEKAKDRNEIEELKKKFKEEYNAVIDKLKPKFKLRENFLVKMKKDGYDNETLRFVKSILKMPSFKDSARVLENHIEVGPVPSKTKKSPYVKEVETPQQEKERKEKERKEKLEQRDVGTKEEAIQRIKDQIKKIKDTPGGKKLQQQLEDAEKKGDQDKIKHLKDKIKQITDKILKQKEEGLEKFKDMDKEDIKKHERFSDAEIKDITVILNNFDRQKKPFGKFLELMREPKYGLSDNLVNELNMASKKFDRDPYESVKKYFKDYNKLRRKLKTLTKFHEKDYKKTVGEDFKAISSRVKSIKDETTKIKNKLYGDQKEDIAKSFIGKSEKILDKIWQYSTSQSSKEDVIEEIVANDVMGQLTSGWRTLQRVTSEHVEKTKQKGEEGRQKKIKEVFHRDFPIDDILSNLKGINTTLRTIKDKVQRRRLPGKDSPEHVVEEVTDPYGQTEKGEPERVKQVRVKIKQLSDFSDAGEKGKMSDRAFIQAIRGDYLTVTESDKKHILRHLLEQRAESKKDILKFKTDDEDIDETSPLNQRLEQELKKQKELDEIFDKAEETLSEIREEKKEKKEVLDTSRGEEGEKHKKYKVRMEQLLKYENDYKNLEEQFNAVEKKMGEIKKEIRGKDFEESQSLREEFAKNKTKRETLDKKMKKLLKDVEGLREFLSVPLPPHEVKKEEAEGKKKKDLAQLKSQLTKLKKQKENETDKDEKKKIEHRIKEKENEIKEFQGKPLEYEKGDVEKFQELQKKEDKAKVERGKAIEKELRELEDMIEEAEGKVTDKLRKEIAAQVDKVEKERMGIRAQLRTFESMEAAIKTHKRKLEIEEDKPYATQDEEEIKKHKENIEEAKSKYNEEAQKKHNELQKKLKEYDDKIREVTKPLRHVSTLKMKFEKLLQEQKGRRAEKQKDDTVKYLQASYTASPFYLLEYLAKKASDPVIKGELENITELLKLHV